MVGEREAEKGGEERQASSLPPGKRVHSAPSTSNKKKTRDNPDLTICHRCGLRFRSDSPRDRLLPLRSQWRVVLLCKPCLSLLRSALACSYCFEQVEKDSSSLSCLDCLRCSRRVHRHCIPREQRCVTPQHLDPASFTCIDCCAIPRSRITAPRTAATTAAHLPSVSLQDVVKNAEKKAEAAAMAKESALKKAVAAKRATELARDALGAVLVEKKGSPPKPSADSVVPDEQLALQLHLAMNGSQRISRSSSRLGRGPVDPMKVRSGGGGDSKPSAGRDVDLGDLRVCGEVEFCTEDKSFFDCLEKTGLDLGSDGQEEKKLADRNGKDALVDKHDNGSLSDLNDHVLPPGFGKNGIENLSELQQKKSSTSDRYLKKYCKRNSRLKAVVNRDDSRLVPCSQII